jgi:hypothetical protein
MEMRVALKRILRRTELRAAAQDPDPIEFRAITLAPRDGVRVIQQRPPGPAPGATEAPAGAAQALAGAAPV